MQVLPAERLKQFTASQLLVLMGGRGDVDVDAMSATCAYTDGMTNTTPQCVWFWEVMRHMTPQLKQAVLKFCCGARSRPCVAVVVMICFDGVCVCAAGTEKIPVDGLEPPFTLTLSNAAPDALPKAHTCFNQLVCASRVINAVRTFSYCVYRCRCCRRTPQKPFLKRSSRMPYCTPLALSCRDSFHAWICAVVSCHSPRDSNDVITVLLSLHKRNILLKCSKHKH